MIAYLDLPSGLSGDMFLGCLVDAGWPLAALQETVAALGVPAQSWTITSCSVTRRSLRATLVEVTTGEQERHRHLEDIRHIIRSTTLPVAVQDGAVAVFTRLARAEAEVHGVDVEKVHFHEVGALDALIDIVGVCAGLADLGVERLYASGVPLGSGWVNAAHGMLPVPAPATLALLTAVKAPTRSAPGPGELVTPTGAALLAEFATFAQPEMRLDRVGIGSGQKEFEWPNVARLWLGQPLTAGTMVQLETNIDDMIPEMYGAVNQRLFAAGAVDVWTTPIQMKKERPGVLLSVLAPISRESTLAELMLRETTTLGVRVHEVRRHEARREVRRVQCLYGEVQIKLRWVGDELVGAKPEYEDCRTLAELQGVPLRQVYEAAQAAAHHQFIVQPPCREERK